jgi:outer membrane protein TolC
LRVEARHFNGGSQVIREYDTGIFFSIPWGNARKYAAQEREARSRVEMATHDLEAARAETLGLVRDGLKKVETFRHHVDLFRDRLLPAARQTVEASQAGYESDKTGFLDLITTQRNLRDIESLYHRHLADYYIALAELEAVVGAELGSFPPVDFMTPRKGGRK